MSADETVVIMASGSTTRVAEFESVVVSALQHVVVVVLRVVVIGRLS